MGVSWSFDCETLYFNSKVGDNFEHLEYLKKLSDGNNIEAVVLEQLNFFRNAKTVRQLLLKTGYVAYSLTSNPRFISTLSPRKWLGCKTKQDVFNLLSYYGCTNNDESDSLALLLFFIKKKDMEVKIEKGTL